MPEVYVPTIAGQETQSVRQKPRKRGVSPLVDFINRQSQAKIPLPNDGGAFPQAVAKLDRSGNQQCIVNQRIGFREQIGFQTAGIESEVLTNLAT